jgi:hypothetical protein
LVAVGRVVSLLDGPVPVAARLSATQEAEMPEISKPGKSVYVRMGVWWDENQGHIHLTAPGVEGFHTTLNSTPGSNNLFRKLAKLLRDEGAPHPPLKDT